MSAFLEVRDLAVEFATDAGAVRAVDGVSFTLERGRTLAIVGESGCGKSTTAAAIMGFHGQSPNARATGRIEIGGDEILTAPLRQLRQLRGTRVAMIFQDPLSALHPCYTIGRQLVEAIIVHKQTSKRAARASAIDMLGRVGIPEPDRRVDEYPHQFSGGMRQRVMIAMALINQPELLIADEPTTALDVTVQSQILELLVSLQKEFGTALLLITHDLGVVARVADEVCVMYGGRFVESGTIRDVFYRPQMPYTWGLLQSLPRLNAEKVDRLPQISGQPPLLTGTVEGCLFRPRCGFHALAPEDGCATTSPQLREVAAGHWARCHLSDADRERELVATRRRMGAGDD
ncbi:MAG: ABC transporter ATP-binding protein [Actinomycetia bacterium]|nr:ABC transporter ATP-binding protein [Actinomycetes bacterium]